ncbi:MAG: hypothetical protein REH83_02715 [Rickettsiella sp.]|nr:hypothetical protein [Rickettsiella sp.]
MAQAPLVDTLYYAKKLEEAGFSQALAEAQTILMTELFNSNAVQNKIYTT